jgi:hypothetical protein
VLSNFEILEYIFTSAHFALWFPCSTMEAAALSQIDTDWPADSVEFCPHADAADIFVCGTYKLEESAEGEPAASAGATPTQRRTGKCLVFRADAENGEWSLVRD